MLDIVSALYNPVVVDPDGVRGGACRGGPRAKSLVSIWHWMTEGRGARRVGCEPSLRAFPAPAGWQGDGSRRGREGGLRLADRGRGTTVELLVARGCAGRPRARAPNCDDRLQATHICVLDERCVWLTTTGHVVAATVKSSPVLIVNSLGCEPKRKSPGNPTGPPGLLSLRVTDPQINLRPVSSRAPLGPAANL